MIVPGVGWSDHWSFAVNGYSAVMVTDTAGFRNPHYHSEQDTPDTLDYRRMANVVRGLAIRSACSTVSPDISVDCGATAVAYAQSVKIGITRLGDDALGDGEVDHPTGAHQQRSGENVRRADHQHPGRVRQHLRARAHADRVPAKHPGAVTGEVSLRCCDSAEDERHQHAGAEHDAKRSEERAVVLGQLIRRLHP